MVFRKIIFLQTIGDRKKINENNININNSILELNHYHANITAISCKQATSVKRMLDLNVKYL
jgi:hypothetical protein